MIHWELKLIWVCVHSEVGVSCTPLPWLWLPLHSYFPFPFLEPDVWISLLFSVTELTLLETTGLFVIFWLCRTLTCWEQVLTFHSNRKRVGDVERRTAHKKFSHVFLLDGESREQICCDQGQVVCLPSLLLGRAKASNCREYRVWVGAGRLYSTGPELERPPRVMLSSLSSELF